jgi:hypothetical protein
MTEIRNCPFCDHTDVEIGEITPGQIAVDCPECGCIGPYGDTVDEAIRRWNAPHARNLSLEHEVRKINEWARSGK